MVDFLLVVSIITIVVISLSVLFWHLSYYLTYYTAWFLYKWLMPVKNKSGDTWKTKSWIWLPFIIGFILDIYWNVVHFSFDLRRMNKFSNKPAKFWPRFRDVKGPKTLYKITLTERLQIILDTYETNTQAYLYALEMREKLNKYDKDHLTLPKGKY